MGQYPSKNTSSRTPSFARPRPSTTSNQKDSTWRETWKDTLTSFGLTTTASQTLPTDNIFAPIAADDILPQIPIGRHHPVPRKGIEDDEDQTLHPNKFYANAFLGNQDQPIWTHPYSIWWGKGHDEDGQYPTWGMSIGYVTFRYANFHTALPRGSIRLCVTRFKGLWLTLRSRI
jgi:endo-1,3(4)-beta-glucanase